MNEIELLRNQLASERRHVREVASACAAAHAAAPARPGDAALEALRGACGAYLALVLDWFERRDQRLGELCAQHPPPDSGRTALEMLKQAGPEPETWQALAEFINGPWDARRGAIEALLASNPRVADWRAFSGIDADSICKERALYGRVRAALPSGQPPGPAQEP